MSTATSDRLTKLQQMLEKQPSDTFLLYAVALEHKKLNQPQQAIDYLKRVVAIDPGYCYAYHQQGLIHESSGDVESAKQAYREGIAAATTKGDAHAKEEIQAALSMIE